MAQVFNVQVFFVCFRECLEAVIVVSVLLAFLKQGLGGASDDPIVYKRLLKQVWFGAFGGLVLCIILGCAFIGAFYSLKNDVWLKLEDLWEGIFCMIATILITFMGLAMLRINKMKEKWRVKLAQALLAENKGRRWLGFGEYAKKYAMFILPFVTVLREGLEAIVFIGGVGLNSPALAFPIPVIVGLLAGVLCGVALYYSGSTMSLQVFLVISTIILYLISAGLFSRGVWFFETYVYNKKAGGDALELGLGPGSYDITKSVWHVNCCNPEIDHGWDVFNALFGWQNLATYGSVISYNVYWIFVVAVIALMWYEERKGHLPFCKNLTLVELNPMYHIKGKKKNKMTKAEQEQLFERVRNTDVTKRASQEAESLTGKDKTLEKVSEQSL